MMILILDYVYKNAYNQRRYHEIGIWETGGALSYNFGILG